MMNVLFFDQRGCLNAHHEYFLLFTFVLLCCAVCQPVESIGTQPGEPEADTVDLPICSALHHVVLIMYCTLQ